jgi:transposase
MGELVRQLDYKATDRSAQLVRVGRYYPSSQTCSRCGARAKLALWERVYHCSTCGLVLDRDVNAARNIRAEGNRLLRKQQHQHDLGAGPPACAGRRLDTRGDAKRRAETR